METKRCIVCHSTLAGRTDKRYCSDQCRFLHNNKTKRTAEKPILELNKQLRKNRTILKNLSPEGRATVRKEVRDALGFDYNTFTSIFITNSKQVYYICYDYAFTPLIETTTPKALIVKRQNFMGDWNPWKYVK